MIDDVESGEDASLIALLKLASRGDPAALNEIVRKYEAAICRVARVRLRASGLTAIVSEEDIAQSAMANFYRAALTGRFDFESPEQLFSLLAKITHHQVNKRRDFYRAARRDISRTVGDGALLAQSGREPTPSHVVSCQELAALVNQQLVEEEKELLAGRAAGRSWSELAKLIGSTPEAARKRAERASERVAKTIQAVNR